MSVESDEEKPEKVVSSISCFSLHVLTFLGIDPQAILVTGVECTKEFKATISKLGGRLVDSPKDCTHLVMFSKKIKVTSKVTT